VLQRIKDEKKFLLESLKTLISIETPSSKEGPAIRFIMNLLDNYSIPYELQHIEGDSYNLIINPVKRPKLIIASHVDTVQPYVPLRVKDEFIVGRGACDVKSGVAIILTLSISSRIPDDLSLVILSQEETSGAGSVKYLKDFYPEFAIVIEPTELKIATAGYGYIEARILIEGEAHHPNSIAARNPLKNPILRLGELHNVLSSLLKDLEFTYTRIHSSGFEYSTPESVELSLEIMVPPDKDAYKVMTHLINEIKIGKVIIEDISSGFRTKNDKFVRLISEAFKKALNEDAELAAMMAWTDANNFAINGVDSIVFGPGSLEHAHSMDEKVKIEDVWKAYKVLREVINLYSQFL